jgi:hypothetical protein
MVYLTRQGIIASIGQALVILSMLFPFGPLAERFGMIRFLFALVYAAVSIIVVYNANCLVVGNCNIWAYIIAILVLLSGIGSFASPILFALQGNDESSKNNNSGNNNNNGGKNNNNGGSSASENKNNSNNNGSTDESNTTDNGDSKNNDSSSNE